MHQVAWAIDLKLRYSDSMAMTRLMLYVSAGHFDPSLSAFVIPVRTKTEKDDREERFWKRIRRYEQFFFLIQLP